MAHRQLHTCPACNGTMYVAEYHCPACGVTVQGAFAAFDGKLAGLSMKDQDFIEQFVLCRGSIKEMEKVLGVSYPTVRSRLNEIITRLGYQRGSFRPDKKEREEILEKLEQGEISAEEAARLIRGEGNGRENENTEND